MIGRGAIIRHVMKMTIFVRHRYATKCFSSKVFLCFVLAEFLDHLKGESNFSLTLCLLFLSIYEDVLM